jgi:hypothetical protein
MSPRSRPRSVLAAPAFLIALSLVAGPSLAGTTSESLAIGGLGTTGCQGPEDPPTLGGGVLASGTIGYAYDEATGILTLTVANDSPVTMGVPNPLITKVWINLPHLAVSGVSLLSQSGSGGASPSFELSFDTNNLDEVGSIPANCFGKMGLLLATSGGSIQGGIANPAADTLPGPSGAAVIGPVTFTLQITGPGADSLTADAFAASLSANPPGSMQVNAAFKFQGGGIDEESGTIGDGPGCRVGGWIVGEPNIGNTVQFVMDTPEGCHGCIVASGDPGPTMFGSLTVPIGMPMVPIMIVTTAPPTPTVLDLAIPNDPNLVGVTIYFVVAAIDPMTLTGLNITDQFSVTIGP